MNGLKPGDRVELPATRGVVRRVDDVGVHVLFDGSATLNCLAGLVAESLVRVKPPFTPREGGIYRFACSEVLRMVGSSWRYFDTNILTLCTTAELIEFHGEPVELKLVPVTE